MLRSEAEQRRLSVQSCAIVGPTSLDGLLGPEESADVIRGYLRSGAGGIGYFGQYLGNGLQVCFGHPYAQDNDTGQVGYVLSERVMTRLP